jgi:hypothetical protein
MKYDYVEMISGRIYCPSTDEVIMTLDEMQPINEEAKALMAAWYSHDILDSAVFNNEKISKDWEEYLNEFPEETRQHDLYDKLCNFLEDYEAPGWRVYQIETSGLACGPVSHTDWYVVLEDTVIEGNDFNEE